VSSSVDIAVQVINDWAPRWKPRTIRPSRRYCSTGSQNKSRQPWTTTSLHHALHCWLAVQLLFHSRLYTKEANRLTTSTCIFVWVWVSLNIFLLHIIYKYFISVLCNFRVKSPSISWHLTSKCKTALDKHTATVTDKTLYIAALPRRFQFIPHVFMTENFCSN